MLNVNLAGAILAQGTNWDDAVKQASAQAQSQGTAACLLETAIAGEEESSPCMFPCPVS